MTVRARYRRSGRTDEVERELAPYGLVLKAGVWYLCARVDDDFRVYRIDRFTAVAVDRTRFVRDEGFDLAGFWEQRAAQFARSLLRTEVTVRLSESGYACCRTPLTGLPPRPRWPGPPLDADGWRTLTLAVESLEVAFGQLLALGAELEVLAPGALRERFSRTAERLHDLYR
ncbi:WYL domain-containing protein [Streptomyces sp. M10(2022)]